MGHSGYDFVRDPVGGGDVSTLFIIQDFHRVSADGHAPPRGMGKQKYLYLGVEQICCRHPVPGHLEARSLSTTRL